MPIELPRLPAIELPDVDGCTLELLLCVLASGARALTRTSAEQCARLIVASDFAVAPRVLELAAERFAAACFADGEDADEESTSALLSHLPPHLHAAVFRYLPPDAAIAEIRLSSTTTLWPAVEALVRSHVSFISSQAALRAEESGTLEGFSRWDDDVDRWSARIAEYERWALDAAVAAGWPPDPATVCERIRAAGGGIDVHLLALPRDADPARAAEQGVAAAVGACMAVALHPAGPHADLGPLCLAGAGWRAVSAALSALPQALESLCLTGCGGHARPAALRAALEACAGTLQRLQLGGCAGSLDASVVRAVGELRALSVLDVSRCGALGACASEGESADEVLGTLAERLARHGALRALCVANMPVLTDGGVRAAGEALRGLLQDVCIYGCYRVTDSGVLHLATKQLRRINFNGCYKVTETGRRILLSVNPHVLFYNKPREFAK